MEFNNNQLKEMYEKMLEARYFEEEVDRQRSQGHIYGPVQLAIGQEACAIGAGAALEDGDYVSLTHRGHMQALGAGAEPEMLMAEIFGKDTGPGSGKSGSEHYMDKDNHILSANGVVGAGYPLACGAALTQKLQETGKAVLCFGGDGSVNEGNFHEALNLAALWKLPVVFFIENNLYSRSTPLEEHSSVINLSDRALSYSIPGITIDGNDVIETYGITRLALDYARRGEGPVLIEALTYRISPDSDKDNEGYRDENEIKSWKEEDPIPRMADYLLHNEIADEEELYDLERKARHRIAGAVNFARQSPEPGPEKLRNDIYS